MKRYLIQLIMKEQILSWEKDDEEDAIKLINDLKKEGMDYPIYLTDRLNKTRKEMQ